MTESPANDIYRTLKLFSSEAGIIEVRALNCWKNKPDFKFTQSGYYDREHLKDAVNHIIGLEKAYNAGGIYITGAMRAVRQIREISAARTKQVPPPTKIEHNHQHELGPVTQGTRLGKTTTHLSLMAKVAGTAPRNMMLAGPTKEAIGRVVSGRLYPLLESTPLIEKGMLPEHRRSKYDVRLEACRIYVGWSG